LGEIGETSEHWKVEDSIAALTTDNASVMINAARRAGLERLPCACHILHNSVKAALGKQERLNNLVIKLHKLALIFHRGPKMAQALEREQVCFSCFSQTNALGTRGMIFGIETILQI